MEEEVVSRDSFTSPVKSVYLHSTFNSKFLVCVNVPQLKCDYSDMPVDYLWAYNSKLFCPSLSVLLSQTCVFSVCVSMMHESSVSHWKSARPLFRRTWMCISASHTQRRYFGTSPGTPRHHPGVSFWPARRSLGRSSCQQALDGGLACSVLLHGFSWGFPDVVTADPWELDADDFSRLYDLCQGICLHVHVAFMMRWSPWLGHQCGKYSEGETQWTQVVLARELLFLRSGRNKSLGFFLVTHMWHASCTCTRTSTRAPQAPKTEREWQTVCHESKKR